MCDTSHIQNEIKELVESVKKNKYPYVICPKCKRGGMEYGYNGSDEWVCLWKDCFYRTDEIPSVQEIKDLIKLKNQLEQIKKLEI